MDNGYTSDRGPSTARTAPVSAASRRTRIAARPSRERGMTFLGLLILVAFVGLFVYAGIRLVPGYLEYMNVVKAMESMKQEAGANPQAFRIALEKRFDIDDVKSLDWRDIEITRDGDNWLLHAAYEYRTSFIANVGFVVNFDKSVEVPTS
jgi:hypothetical protein